MTATIAPVAPDHPAFAEVAALFDDYRVHHGHPSAPAGTGSWLRDQPGVTSAFLDHVVRGARAAGALRVSLHTGTGNVAALKLYTAIGFEPVTGLELLDLTLGSP